jgi:hypothetical protein
MHAVGQTATTRQVAKQGDTSQIIARWSESRSKTEQRAGHIDDTVGVIACASRCELVCSRIERGNLVSGVQGKPPVHELTWRETRLLARCFFKSAYFTKNLLPREMWLNRLDAWPQGNSQTIAPDYFPSGDRSSCDGTFFLKVNSYKWSQCDNAQKLFR